MPNKTKLKSTQTQPILLTSLITGVAGFLAFSLYVPFLGWFQLGLLVEPLATLLTLPAVAAAMVVAWFLLGKKQDKKLIILAGGAFALVAVRICEQFLLYLLPEQSTLDPIFIISRLALAIVATFAGLLFGNWMSSRKPLSILVIPLIIILGTGSAWMVYEIRSSASDNMINVDTLPKD